MLLRNRFVTEGRVPRISPRGTFRIVRSGLYALPFSKNLRKRSCYGRFQLRVLVVCAEFFHNRHTSSDRTLRDASLANNIGLECRLSKGPACRREFNSREPGIFSRPGVSGGPAGRPPEAAFAGGEEEEEEEEALQGKLGVQGLGG